MNLKDLNVNRNTFAPFPAKAFEGLINLTSLSLGYNALQELEA
jgi:Leucine-rich repeat (LRR) protein